MAGRPGRRRGDGRRRARVRGRRRAASSWRKRSPIPARADEMDALLERFGDGAGALRRARRLRARGAGARDPRRPRLLAGDAWTATWASSRAAGRCASPSRASCSMRPDAMLLDEPSNHLDLESLIWLEGFLKGYEGALLMTSHDREFMNRIVGRDHRDRRRRADQLLGQLRVLRAAARAERGAGRGRVRTPAGDAGQGDALHRALQGAGRQGVAGAVARQEARQDREGRAAQAAQDAGLRVPALPALGRGRGPRREACTSATARASSTTASTCSSAAASAGRSWASTAPASRRCSS